MPYYVAKGRRDDFHSVWIDDPSLAPATSKSPIFLCWHELHPVGNDFHHPLAGPTLLLPTRRNGNTGGNVSGNFTLGRYNARPSRGCNTELPCHGRDLHRT